MNQLITHASNSQCLQAQSHTSRLPQLVPGMKVDKLSNPYAQADYFAQSKTREEICLGLERGISSSQSNNKLLCGQHKESTGVEAGWGRLK